MTVDPKAMRIGEVLDVVAEPLDEQQQPAALANELWNLTAAGVVDLQVPDPEAAPREATIEAIASGTVGLRFEGVNAFFDEVEIVTPITVLAPNRLEFRVGATANCEILRGEMLLIRPTSTELTGTFQASAIPRDEREIEGQPSYGGLTSITWSSLQGRVLFDSGGGPAPTATGTLSLTVVLDAAGEDTIIVTAENSIGQPIEGRRSLRVLAAVTARMVFTAVGK